MIDVKDLTQEKISELTQDVVMVLNGNKLPQLKLGNSGTINNFSIDNLKAFLVTSMDD